MFKTSSFKLISVSTLMLVTTLLRAGIIQFSGPIIETTFSPFTPVIVTSSSTVSVSPMTDPSFNDVSVIDLITLAVKHESDKYISTIGNVVVGLKVQRWDKDNNPLTDTFPSLELKYQPFPSSGLPYVDKAVLKLHGAYKYTVTVLSMTLNGTPITNLLHNLTISTDIFIERYRDFSSAVSTQIAMLEPVATDADCDGKDDELTLRWPTLVGAEEYQLEWTFVNDYDYVTKFAKEIYDVNYTFKDNCTRVTIPGVKNSYKLNLNFDQGYVVYRIRGIGRDFTNPSIPLPGTWDVVDSDPVSSAPANNIYQITVAHEHDKNWQYSATYAEEGKRKEVISYFDGSLRNRQTVTRLSSDTTITIAGETIYDHQGRPAVNVLPAPVKLPDCNDPVKGLRYYPNLNRAYGTTLEYSRANFDVDATGDSCNSILTRMDTLTGASRYYSSTNSEKGGFQAFVPDAERYPFSQTEYTPDNTGRIRRQGGVGKQFQLTATGHYTTYYYGSPAQQQLDRLFGSEAGDATHYKKNIVVDANGMTSVTYLDQEGRTVATALAGDGPASQDSLLTPNKKTGAMTIDLLNKDANGVSTKNTISVQGDAIEFSSQLLVAFPNKYRFYYDMNIPQFPSGCLAEGICFNCVYDLEIILTDDCGKIVVDSSGKNPVMKRIGRFTADGSGNFVSFNTTCVFENYTNSQYFTINTLQPGNYTLTKRLTINKEAKDYYIGNYFQTTDTPVQGTYVNLQPGCIKTYQQFIDASMAKVDTTDCNVSCAACVASMKGSYASLELARDGFVADGKGSEMDFDFLVEQCNSSCKEVSVCEANYQMMLMDVSPDGQYAEFQPRDNGTEADMNLSVFNTGNRLLKNKNGTGNWRYPSIVINGNTYGVYVDKNGNRARVPVVLSGQTCNGENIDFSIPDVDDCTKIYFDPATQSHYTYPENLRYLKDFIARWDDSWAGSLVAYHPEYPYYQSCLDYNKKWAGFLLSSDTFDSLLLHCETYADAYSKGLVVNSSASPGGTVASRVLFNKATGDNRRDPFITNFGTYGDQLRLNSDNYAELSAKAARCGTRYEENPVAAGCSDFSKNNDVELLNNEWNILKNMYLAEKQRLQKLRDETTAKANKAYNGCFGNSSYDAVTNGMIVFPFASSLFLDLEQPCGIWLKQFYVDKKRRFNVTSEVTEAPNKEEAEYQLYLQTGQSPMMFSVQNLLAALAKKSSLTYMTGPGKALQALPEFSKDMYAAVYGSLPLPSVYVPYYWRADTVATNRLSANIVLSDGTTIKSTVKLVKTSTAFTWSQVVTISQLKFTSAAGSTYNFSALAAVANTAGSVRPYTYYPIVGSTNFILNNYNPTAATLNKCKPNQLSKDLAILWTALAMNGDWGSTGGVALSPAYDPLITTSIKNVLGTTTTALTWKKTSSSPEIYELYETIARRLVMQVDSGNTSSFAYFTDLRNIDSVNAFRVTGKNSSAVVLGQMKGSLNIIDGVTTIPVSLGDCGLPVNMLCTGSEYQVGRDLHKLIKSALLPKPLNVTTMDLAASPAYTPLLQSYIGSSSLGSTVKRDSITLNASNDYKEQITYNLLCKCQVRLWHEVKASQILKFADLASINNLVPYGLASSDNNRYTFYMNATYTGTSATDTIFGESCFPLRACDSKLIVDTAISPVKPYVTPCILNQINNAVVNAANEYKIYNDSLLTDLSSRYTRHCLSAAENLKLMYADKEYHYTLYYYDQAGNLVRTIPPEGVELVTAPADFTAINADRTNKTHNYFTQHRLATTYTYNSLNQLVRQSVPDHDLMDAWEYTLTNGLDSRLKVSATQFISATRGFLTGYIDFTSPTFNRGYLYTTDDGGTTWKKMNNLVAADLKKIQMVNANIGYAVGKNGTVLKTLDGGNSWDLLTVPVTTTINDLHFVTTQTPTPLNGIIVGENNTILITKDGGATWLTTSNSTNLTDSLRAGSSLTSITNDGGYLFMTGNVNGNGYIYRAAVNSFNTTSFNITLPWTRLSPVSNTGIRSTDIMKVNMADKTRGFAIAMDGNLVKTIDAGSNWLSVPTGVSGEFRDIAFMKMNGVASAPLNAVAIIDSVPGRGLLYQTNDGGVTWKQLSPNDGNYYNAVYLMQDFANREKGYAVGSKIKRIVYKNNNFVLVNVPVPATAPLNLKTVYFSDPNNGWVASSSKAYYTTNAMASTPTWTEVTFTGFSIKKIYFSSTNNSGLVVSQDGAVYKITPSGGTYIFTKISTGSEFYMDMNTTHTHVFILTRLGSPNIIRSVSKVNVAAAVSLGTLTGSGGMTSGNAAALYTFDVDSAGSNVLVGGADGRLFKGVATSTTAVWSDNSRRLTPLPLYDIESPCAGTIIAVGAEGTLLQCTDRNTYRTVPTRTVAQYNAAKFNKNGYVALGAVKGLIAGNGGSLTKIDITAASLITMLPLQSTVTADLNDIAVKDNGSITKAYVAGAGGTLISIPNLDVPAPVLASLKPADDFNGIAYRSSAFDVFTVGNNTSVYNYNGTAGAKVNGVYVPALYDVSFANAANGYVIGDKNTIRYTANGGGTWKYVSRTSTGVMHAVGTYAPGKAVITGASAYLGTADTTVVTDGSTSGTYYDIEFSGFNGCMVGTSAQKIAVNPTTYALTYSTPSGFPASTTFRGVHLFRNGSFIAVGDAAKIYCYNTAYVAFPLASGTPNLKDVYFHDDRNGYAVGDGGAIYRGATSTDIHSISSTPGTSIWNALSLAGTNGATTPADVNLTTIGFVSRYKGFIGGRSVTGTINFARGVNDETKLFTTRFWYDALGRMVVSQNTKQYNRKTAQSGRSDFSYTVYDALGRIKEVGEKTDNTSPNTIFAGIFGKDVNGRYNPGVINDAGLASWLSQGSAKREVTHTYYDKPLGIVPTGVAQQASNLRKRVSCVTYEDVNDGDSLTYQNGSYYDYDIHGNVKTLWQDNKSVAVTGQKVKRVDYEYDLISGKVNLVRYQDGEADCFYHYYTYDADNRLQQVYTSSYPWRGCHINAVLVEGNRLWSREAKYFYYAHGPLARVEVGEFKNQGMDYAYTLQGWLKGVNSNLLTPGTDMGNDGVNANSVRDAFGYSLLYYGGDYLPIDGTEWSPVANRFEARTTNSDLLAARNNLYNGNITAMVTNLSEPKVYSSAANEFPTYLPQGTAYKYDHLNRIKNMQAYTNLNAANYWQNGSTYADRYKNTYTYDGNGNIVSQLRYNAAGAKIDELSYKYVLASGKLSKNRLRYVTDAAPSGTATDDLETQDSTNYGYDEIGNLQRDAQEEIDTIKWTVYGKIRSIRRTSASTKSNLEFVYDAAGNRIAKIEKPDGTAKENGPSDQPDSWKITYYVRDAQGNVMGNYYYTRPGGTASYKLQERVLYGSSRLGTESVQLEMVSATVPTTLFTRILGNKYFEAVNHLGNVLSIFTDKKIPRDDNTDTTIDYFQPEVIAGNDYTPFGAPMTERTFSSNKYRYGFNGKENDNEVKGQGNQQDYGMRIYDNRLGRFLSVDPLTKSYPMLTPYQFASNSPIAGIDLDGLEFYYTADGALIGKIGTSTEVRVVDSKDVKKVTGNIYWANGTSNPDYALRATNQANQFSTALGINNEQLVAFASVIDNESGGAKSESYAIGNVTMNYIKDGGSVKDLKTLDDVTMYDNSFAQGARQDVYTLFKNKTPAEQNSKFALGAAINALGVNKGLAGFKDETEGADGWDGTDLISSKAKNSHRGYSWSDASKNMLSTYQKNNNGGIDVSKWNYKKTGFQIEATKIIGKTLFTNVKTPRGEHKESKTKFE